MTTVPTPETRLPRAPRVGLYDPRFEHDACGVALVADLEGKATHTLVRQAISALEHLAHRGATGSEEDSGDGAGILIQIPHDFYADIVDFDLPARGTYATGLVFLSRTTTRPPPPATPSTSWPGRRDCAVIGWRDVPIHDGTLGSIAEAAMPSIHQLFVAPTSGTASLGADPALAIDRLAFVLRKRAEHEIDECYLPTLSARTITYKGMLTSHQLAEFYPDLSDERVVSGLALVHSRFSTNTFPSWPLAHPYRYLAHNGEINTAAGNRNWMRAREALCASDLIPGLERAFPIVTPGASDSASFDEVLELLHLGGRPLHHAVLMMIPEAWENHRTMDPARRAFYRYHASLDGALGRAGRRGVHRRNGHRGGARPQRATAGPLLGDRRRHGGAGQRGGRDRRAARQGGPEGPPAAGPDVPRGHLGRPDRRRRRDQGRAGGRAPLRRVARCRPDRARGATPPDDAHPPARVGGRAASDCSATPTRSCA